MKLRKKEVLRYLGYHQNFEINENTNQEIDQCVKQVEKCMQEKYVYQRFPIIRKNHEIHIESLIIKEPALLKNLENCHEVILLAATIGIEIDRLIKKAQIQSISQAIIYQAVGAEAIEYVMDKINKQLKEEINKEGYYLKPRFSPGYGNTPLSMQKAFESLIHMSQIGIYLNNHYLMTPSKSVTAFIGISNYPVKLNNTCQMCNQVDCEMKKDD